MTTFPPPLQNGDTIGVIAPSCKWDTNKILETIQSIEARGYKVELHPQTQLSSNQFAGTTADKLSALHDYFQNPDIKAIFCLVGGNGALHLLDKIDYGIIKQNPKIFMGYSDITALLHAIYSQTQLVTYHGPVMSNMERLAKEDINQCFECISGNTLEIELGKKSDLNAEGILIGGNLSMLQALIGTSYSPSIEKDNILLIEDIGDHLSRYDRMIAHMKLGGWFKNTKAILLGEFVNTKDNPDRPFGFTMEEVLKMHAPHVPIIPNVPVGHGKRLITLPIGAKAVLKNGTLSFKSPA